MIFNVLTVFRELYMSPLKYGIVSKAIKTKKLKSIYIVIVTF